MRKITTAKSSEIENFSFIEQIDLFALLTNSYQWHSSQIFLVDLAPSVEEAIVKIANRIAEDKNAKILAVNAPSFDVAIEVLASGASGVIDSALSVEQIPQIEKALQQDCVYIQTQSPFFIVFPSSRFAEQLKCLQYSIAAQIVHHWRWGQKAPLNLPETELENWSGENLIASLQNNLPPSQSLLAELSALMENFSREVKPESLERSERIGSFLERWFFSDPAYVTSDEQPNCALSIMRHNYHSLEMTMSSQLSESCLNWEHHSSSGTLQTLLKNAVESLKEFEIESEKLRQRTSIRGHSAKFARFCLQDELTRHPTSENFHSVLRALKLQYEAEIQARSLEMAGLIIHRGIFLLNNYRDHVATTDDFLHRMQQHFQAHFSEERSPKIVDFNPFQQLRHRLVESFGCFARWGGLSAQNHHRIELAILQEAKKIACNVLLSSY